MTMNAVRVHRGQIYDAVEAGRLLGLPSSLVRQWIRMRLLRATKVGITWAIRAEDLAEASRRFHAGYFADVPRPRDGTPISVIELI